MPPSTVTRPTTDRVREAAMSAMLSRVPSFESLVVLDAFAGSGALGLEALSRGAGKACFFEKDARAFKVLEANVASLGARDRSRLSKRDVLRHPPCGGGPFDLVFLDPPYATDLKAVLGLITALDSSGALAPGALVYYEHLKSLDLSLCEADEAVELEPVTHKRHGDIAFDLLRKPERP